MSVSHFCFELLKYLGGLSPFELRLTLPVLNNLFVVLALCQLQLRKRGHCESLIIAYNECGC